MLSSLYFRQTSRRFIIITTRATLSISPNPKPTENPTNKFEADNNKSISSSNDPSEATRLAKTIILSGVPVTGKTPTLANEEQRIRTKEQEVEHQHDRIPASRFSAFLRGIRSGLPFFPSKKNKPVSIDIATTREHFIPVGYF